MADRPLEYELVMSTYTQFGQDLSNYVDHLDTYIPSGIEENDLGFDMQIPDLKGIVFQFKRPKGDRLLRFRVRYSDQDSPRQLDRMRNWELKFGPNVAFYALPLVIDHSDLENTLRRTAFLPASVIDPLASVIRIPSSYIQEGRRAGTSSIEIYCSEPNCPSNSKTVSVNNTAVLGWEELKENLGACKAGFWLREEGSSRFDQYHDDHSWYPRPMDTDTEMRISEINELEGHLFIGDRDPLFTRLGSDSSLSW